MSVTFKNQVVLKDASWEVKRGERVGLVGVNGSGKTTQLQVSSWALEARARAGAGGRGWVGGSSAGGGLGGHGLGAPAGS